MRRLTLAELLWPHPKERCVLVFAKCLFLAPFKMILFKVSCKTQEIHVALRQHEVTPLLFQARQLVKDGFLVEVSESSRKVRHVFLFTDLLLCAKMKKTAVGWVQADLSFVSRCRKACYRCVNTHLQTLTFTEQQHVPDGCYTWRHEQRFVFPRLPCEGLWHRLCNHIYRRAPCLASTLATVRLTGSHFGWHLLFESFVAASHSRSTLCHLNIAAHVLTNAHTCISIFLRTFPDIIYSPAS